MIEALVSLGDEPARRVSLDVPEWASDVWAIHRVIAAPLSRAADWDTVHVVERDGRRIYPR